MPCLYFVFRSLLSAAFITEHLHENGPFVFFKSSSVPLFAVSPEVAARVFDLLVLFIPKARFEPRVINLRLGLPAGYLGELREPRFSGSAAPRATAGAPGEAECQGKALPSFVPEQAPVPVRACGVSARGWHPPVFSCSLPGGQLCPGRSDGRGVVKPQP